MFNLIFAIVMFICGVLISNYVEKINKIAKEERRIKQIFIRKSINKEIERLKSFGFEDVYKN